MITPQTLNIYLKYFGASQQKRGKDLYRKGAVSDVIHHPESRIYTANVQGGQYYNVTLKYLSKTQIVSGICSCPYRSLCKHQVALIHQLLDKSNNRSAKIIHLEGKTGEFRKLQVNYIEDLYDLVSKNHRSFRYSKDSYGYELAGPSTIKAYVRKSKMNFYDFEESEELEDKVTVEIKLEEDGISIKCNKCNVKSSGLCTEEATVLSELVDLESFRKWFNKKITYEDVVKSMAAKEGMAPSFLAKYCSIYLSGNSFQLVQRDQRILFGEEWDDFRLSFDAMTAFKSTEDSIFLDHNRTEYQDKKGNALMWYTDKEKGIGIIPQIISGKLNGDRTKLSSYIEKAHALMFADSQQVNFFYNFEKFISINQKHDFAALLTRIYNFLYDHSQQFFSFLHYLHQPEEDYYGYRQEKILRKDLHKIIFNEERAGLQFEVEPVEELYSLKTNLILGAKVVPLDEIEYHHYLFVVVKKRAYLYQNPDVFFYLNMFGKKGEMLFDKSKSEFFTQFVYKFSKKFEIGTLPDGLTVDTVELSGGEKKLLVKESGRILTFEPVISYEDNVEINVLAPYQDLENSEKGHCSFAANESEIVEFIDFMDKSHDKLKESREGYEFYYLNVEDTLKNNWFLDFFENCKTEGITVFGENLLENFKFNKNKATVSNSVASGIDWFDLKVEMSFGKEKVSTARWVEAIKNKEKYVQLSDGSLGILPEEWLSKLQKIAQYSEIKAGQLKISKLSFNVVEELFTELGEDDLVEEIQLKKARLLEFDSIKKHPLPRTVTANLRDYQKKGFQWLKFLDEFQFGGCLADDMGLGKTLQVITFLADQKKLKRGTSLAVVPRSLLFNWAVEIEKFCPSLTYLIHHGPNRNFDLKAIAAKDLIISTYDTVTIDIESIREFDFNYCILDESQAIKNPNSKRYKAMRLIQSSNRLVMTGTPIENNTFDLYGQFSFINPGLFISQSSFKTKFSVPIDIRGDQEAAELLRNLVYPFLLRRTKEQVARDLPEKTESVLMCEMGPRQQKLYDELKLSIRSDLEKKIETDGLNKSRFRILEGLLRMRQMCNSPLLVNSQLSPQRAPSAKLELLLEHVEEVIISHKALIFSQFVSMLTLIRKDLDKKKIKYAYLDGSTKDRQACVDQFQNDDSCKVFLVSLKAGNTGLNLTRAEYVYIVDPWWNPAVEAQAIDRTHRIGQENHVFAYKLICKGTIEEKIVKLQEKKKKIASDIIQTDESILKSLTKEKLMALFD